MQCNKYAMQICNANMHMQKINLQDSHPFHRYIKEEKFLKVYPDENHDGFFIARLKKCL